jgi:hypothetical protein
LSGVHENYLYIPAGCLGTLGNTPVPEGAIPGLIDDDSRSEDKWRYRKLSKTDYQLYGTGASFVSSFDAMVLRYSGRYPKDWFRSLDSSHSKKFGDWYYITGFSSFEQDP